MRKKFASYLAVASLGAFAACTTARTNGDVDHADHDTSVQAPAGNAPAIASLPPDAEGARARLASSPRHGEWVTVSAGADSVRAWIVYPERKTKAPVIVVVHEIYGLTPWVRAVADQLAAEGFIAIAPDLLTMKNLPNPTDSVPGALATAAIRTLDKADIQRYLDVTARHAMALPSALRKYGIIGFCWGGNVAFEHAVHAPALGASVVYYGPSPAPESLVSVRAPVLGLYGGSDARVGATVPPADSAMRALKKTFTHYSYDGAGHGFLRQQTAQSGANLDAARQAWPATIAWFRRYLAP
ncbi:MAG TPA: dienelactone hydrolase family protein [Gemmatimonadaceae bacterium]|nr:dienelactone hydrolase family protein [Gemmatimonadaceae bacterium]